jgi:hypothetical protein
MIALTLYVGFQRSLFAHLENFCECILMVDAMDALVSETFCEGVYISQFKHRGSVLEVVRGMSEDDFEVLIGLAGAAFRTMKDSVNAMSYRDALEKEVGKVKAAANSAACSLEGELRTEFRIKETEYKRILQAREADVAELRRQIEGIKATNQVIEATLQATKAQIGDAERVSWEKYEKILGKTEAEYKENMKERLAELKEIYTKETERVRKENDKSHVSSSKGKQGEREFEDICAEYTGWGPLINTSKETAATDRRGVIKGCNAMFEIKKYKDNVPTTQVVKFVRDMKENPDTPLGVFISLNSNICNKLDKYINIEWSEDSQLLLYINSFNTHSIPDTMEFIDTCAGIAQTVYKTARSRVDTSDNSVALQSRIDQAKFLINKELFSIVDGLKTLDKYKTSLLDMVTNQHNDLKRQMTTTKETLRMMIDALIGKVEEEVVVESVPKKKKTKKVESS